MIDVLQIINIHEDTILYNNNEIKNENTRTKCSF